MQISCILQALFIAAGRGKCDIGHVSPGHRFAMQSVAAEIALQQGEIMKTLTHLIVGLAAIIALALSASAQSSGVMPQFDKELANVWIRHADRTVLGEDIVHYRYDVVVGTGKFDVIRLHRVVRERHPYQPIRTLDGVLLLAGSPNYFEAMFLEPLISQVVPWDRALAVYLAQSDIDVWGMDYAWALVPAGTTDLSFMKGWGLGKDGQHTEIALSLARLLRGLSGQGFGQLNLLGFSYGGIVGYTIAGEEAQRRRDQRNLKGLIIFDVGMKLKEQEYRDTYCGFAAADQANLDAGVYNDDTGLFLKALSDLALSAPNDPSDLIPGTTNYQAALLFGANPALLNGQFWHFVGGFLDENGIPSGLRFTEDRLWLDILQNIPPHLPVQTDFDVDATFCGKIDMPFDDHLGQITLPILLAGAEGGFGQAGVYTTTLTGSKDVTKFIVQRLPDDQRAEDFGHVDTVAGKDAKSHVWKPVLDWIMAHR